MVIGGGMIAKAFADYEASQDVIIFASGVANSLETNAKQFQRESEMLRRARHDHHNKLLVYFSTCSIHDPDRCNTSYVGHKIDIEEWLASVSMPYLILRLPAVIGRTNLAKTFPYYIYSRIMSGLQIDVWSRAVRYPIDIDDVLEISKSIIDGQASHNQCINIALEPYPVMEIIREMERVLNRAAVVNLIDRGCTYEVERTYAKQLADELGIQLGESYLPRVIRKYFNPRETVWTAGDYAR